MTFQHVLVTFQWGFPSFLPANFVVAIQKIARLLDQRSANKKEGDVPNKSVLQWPIQMLKGQKVYAWSHEDKISSQYRFTLANTGCPIKKVSIKNLQSYRFTASIHSF